MIVVINAFSARRGGGQTYLRQLLENFSDKTLKVYLLASSTFVFESNQENIISVNIAWPTENPFLRMLWEVFFLPRFLKRVNADILFCPGGLVNCRVPEGCRVVTTFQNMMPFMPEQRKKFPIGYMRLRHWLLERGLLSGMARSDLVVFLSHFAKDVIAQRLHGRLKRFVVIPHGLSEEFCEQNDAPRCDQIPCGDYMVYVSDFYEYKHQKEVVAAFSIMKKDRQTQEKLVLIGYHKTPYGRNVKSYIKRLGMQKDICICDPVDYSCMPGVYRHAKIVIFASACENCPNILLEAMGVGRPLLVSQCQPMPEFAEEAAMYFDPESSADLAQKLLESVDNPQILKELSEKAKLLAKQYDWKQTAQETWKAFSALGIEI